MTGLFFRIIISTVFAVVFSVAAIVIATGAECRGAGDDSAAERGRTALLSQSHINAMWPLESYEQAWRVWGDKEKPAQFDQQFLQRYGLHPAPYLNDGLPMGLRRAPRRDQRVGMAIDCMLCHGASIAGKSYVGLPNTTIDLPLLFHEMPLASNQLPFPWPFPLARSRGTTNAGAVAVFVLAFRNPDLTPRFPPAALNLHDLPDLDPPAWWLWKKKQTIYAEGGMDAKSVRSTMQFLLGANTPADRIKSLEPVWDDVRAFIWTLEPPKYPLPIDAALAETGKAIFESNCTKCHGTYGPNGKYPNRIVPIDVIGTDRARFDSISDDFRDYYDASWLGESYPTLDSVGYQAPPLDGIWATAPYFHNGSVPTVWDVLNSASRPDRFRRFASTDLDVFDSERLGWKVETVDEVPSGLPAIELRKIYDASGYGKGNGGHTFGDALTDAERRAVIEYLKTL